METYHNDYSKEDDPMMWELHEIRHKIALENLTPKEINRQGREIIEKYNLKVKVLDPKEMGIE